MRKELRPEGRLQMLSELKPVASSVYAAKTKLLDLDRRTRALQLQGDDQ
jgi:hypothetical protein